MNVYAVILKRCRAACVLPRTHRRHRCNPPCITQIPRIFVNPSGCWNESRNGQPFHQCCDKRVPTTSLVVRACGARISRCCFCVALRNRATNSADQRTASRVSPLATADAMSSTKTASRIVFALLPDTFVISPTDLWWPTVAMLA